MEDGQSSRAAEPASVVFTTPGGREVRIRHIRPADAELLAAFYRHLSPETRRLRFLMLMPDLSDDVLLSFARRLAAIDPTTSAALIATVEADGREQAVAVARLSCNGVEADTAEGGLVVRDDYQRQGLGSVLFDLLIQVAMARGLVGLWGVSLADNAGMHRLIQKVGLPYTSRTSHGETTVMIELAHAANDSGPGVRQGRAETI